MGPKNWMKLPFKKKEALPLFFLFFFSFFALRSLLAPGFAFGDDNTSHYVFTFQLAEMFRKGNFHLWDTDQNLGFPMLFYYQPIPYVVTSLMYILLPFVDSLLIYKLIIIVLFSLFPISVYFSMRLMDISKKIALISAFFSILINGRYGLGFEISAFLIWGLFTMLFGMILYPLAVGFVFKEYFGKRRLFLPALLLSLTLLSHSMVGIAANLSLAAIIFLSPGYTTLQQKKEDIAYICKILLLEFILVSFWVVPLLTSLDYYGGHPFESEQTMLGFGVKAVIRELTNGDAFDANRIPIVTAFFFLGIIACFLALQNRKKGKARNEYISQKTSLFLILNFILCLTLLIGPAGLDFLKYLPGIGIIQFSRFWVGVHLFGIIIAGIGAYLILDFSNIFLRYHMPNKKSKVILIGVGIIILLYLISSQYSVLRQKARTFAFEKEDPEYIEVLQFLEKQPEGRLQVNGVTGIKTHFRIYTPPLYAKKPVVISYAVGLQDSLGFYYVETMKEFTPQLLDLYNIRYIIATRDKNFSYLGTRIFSNKKYNLYLLTHTGYFDIVHTNTAVLAKNKESRDLIIQWARGTGLKKKEFLAIGEGKKEGYFRERGFTNFITAQDLMDKSFDISQYLKVYGAGDESCGEVTEEKISYGEYRAKVMGTENGQSCYVMLKVNAHKDWKVFVDGKETDWIEVSPSFMAVFLPSGGHEIQFLFSVSKLRKILLSVSIATVIALWYYENRSISQKRRKVHK